jgi:hypothetical protein
MSTIARRQKALATGIEEHLIEGVRSETERGTKMPSTEKTAPRLTYKDVLYDQPGVRRSEAELRSKFGVRATQIAHIYEQIESAGDPPARIGIPLRIFISYAWDTVHQNKWVHDLAVTLRARGYEVIHDRTSARGGSTADISALVSQIAVSDFFLMIVDPGYIAQVGEYEGQPLERRWAYVEFKLSEFYQDEVFRVGFRRSGASVPRRMTLAAPQSLGDVVDASSPEKLAEHLTLFFRPCLTSRPQPRSKPPTPSSGAT